MHLTGLEPIGKNGRSIKPTKFLHDFANGGELAYDDILIDKFLFVFTQLILHYQTFMSHSLFLPQFCPILKYLH